jgi:hypothetical protein
VSSAGVYGFGNWSVMSAIFCIAQYDHHTSGAAGLHLNFTNLCPAPVSGARRKIFLLST